MIFIALLIFVHGVSPESDLQYSRRELSGLISKMRRHVRTIHTDVRLNTRVGKDLVDFIKQIKEKELEPEPAPKASKGKRKRPNVEEAVQSSAAKQTNRRKVLDATTPTDSASAPPGVVQQRTMPSFDLPDPATSSLPPKNKKYVSLANGSASSPHLPAHPPSNGSPLKGKTTAEVFRSHIPLSPTSSGSHSADRDAEAKGPSNRSVALHQDNDVHMSNGAGADSWH